MKIRDIIVFIYLPGETKAVPAGIFTHDFDLEVGTFAYGRRYLERENAISVDPVALQLGLSTNAVTANCGLYGAFRDGSPDYWGRLVIAAQLKTIPENISEIDFLLNTNATRVGNLDFRTSPDSPEPELTPPGFDQLANLLHGAEDIETGQSVETHILQLLRQGTSMGGARPKCTVKWDNQLWIAKFPAKGDTVNNPRIEYATMKLAQRCGIEIPEIQIKSIADKDMFLIKRFDRTNIADGWLRHGFISSLSLMRLDEKDRLHWSYLTIVSLMRQYCPADDYSELFRRMIFNILVRNTDDHPRNHGFLVTENGLRLAPAYDIVPALTQSGVGTEFNLAMSVGKTGREATLANAMSGCKQFGLSELQGNKIIDQMLKTVHHWQEHFENCGVSKQDIDLLIPSFRKRGE